MIRCFECNKKIQLGMEIKCKCEQYFCMKHKFPEDHNCSFNFKLRGQELLTKKNPIIIGDKINKI